MQRFVCDGCGQEWELSFMCDLCSGPELETVLRPKENWDYGVDDDMEEVEETVDCAICLNCCACACG